MPKMRKYDRGGQMNRGVGTGYRHLWKYKGAWDETKIRKGLWRFTFKATKSHRGRRSEGSFGVGTKGAWRINGIQYIKKISPSAYQTLMVGTKRPLKFYVKKPRRTKYKRY